MTHTDITYDISNEGVATLTFNRPEVMNALRPQTTREVAEAIEDVRVNDAVRCLVITGAGRGFCAGDDFQAIQVARELLVVDPYDEDAHRLLMRANARIGHVAQALRQYLICRRSLIDGLGREPEAETRALHARIVNRDPV